MNRKKIRRIEKLTGRRWWLGHKIWEKLYDMRCGDFDPNFYRYWHRIPLRKFNVYRKKRGYKMISYKSRRYDYSRILRIDI